jgi:predicted O-linked N-acetylglucosamine transferase (SPINDLY family)
VSYLGFPGTMGSNNIDYLLADRVVVPEEDRLHYSERIATLPRSYYPYESAKPVAAPLLSREEAGLPDQGLVFCSFNSSYKITPEIFDIWMRLLREVPGSVLWLLESNRAAVRNLQREAQTRGVAPERLIFAPFEDMTRHRARYALADLFLDTLPCNAHTTAADALWAGLPVLTCKGPSFAGRVAASLLTAIGLPELIVPSLEAYESAALRLARDASALEAMKRKVADRGARSMLFDSLILCRELEAAFAEMHERRERGEAPDHFNVGALSAMR